MLLKSILDSNDIEPLNIELTQSLNSRLIKLMDETSDGFTIYPIHKRAKSLEFIKISNDSAGKSSNFTRVNDDLKIKERINVPCDVNKIQCLQSKEKTIVALHDILQQKKIKKYQELAENDLNLAYFAWRRTNFNC